MSMLQNSRWGGLCLRIQILAGGEGGVVRGDIVLH